MAGADETPTSAKDVLAFCESEDVRFIRLWFTDLLGQLKSFSINSADLEDAFEGGMVSTAPRSRASTRSRSRT